MYSVGRVMVHAKDWGDNFVVTNRALRKTIEKWL